MKEFIEHFTDQFEDTDASLITIDTKFRDIEEWSSILALSIMAMCEEEYNVVIEAEEMEAAQTPRDIYNIVQSRK